MCTATTKNTTSGLPTCRVLILDTLDGESESFAEILKRVGCAVTTTLDAWSPSAIGGDILLVSGADGEWQSVHRRFPLIPTVYVAPRRMSLEVLEFLYRAGTHEICQRPLREAQVWSRLTSHAPAAVAPLPWLEMPGYRPTERQLTTAGASGQALLLLGQPGTGRRFLAGCVHRHGRAGRPFCVLRISSAVADEELARILFGRIDGEACGTPRQGDDALFGRAAGGTLFLTDLQNAGPVLQRGLLHALESPLTGSLDGCHGGRGNARLIAAADRSLPARVLEGTFREDLFQRLEPGILRLEMPPGRELQTAVAQGFAKTAAAAYDLAENAFAARLREILCTLPAPVSLADAEDIAWAQARRMCTDEQDLAAPAYCAAFGRRPGEVALDSNRLLRNSGQGLDTAGGMMPLSSHVGTTHQNRPREA